jgi:hypothetical protein
MGTEVNVGQMHDAVDDPGGLGGLHTQSTFV